MFSVCVCPSLFLTSSVCVCVHFILHVDFYNWIISITFFLDIIYCYMWVMFSHLTGWTDQLIFSVFPMIYSGFSSSTCRSPSPISAACSIVCGSPPFLLCEWTDEMDLIVVSTICHFVVCPWFATFTSKTVVHKVSLCWSSPFDGVHRLFTCL